MATHIAHRSSCTQANFVRMQQHHATHQGCPVQPPFPVPAQTAVQHHHHHQQQQSTVRQPSAIQQRVTTTQVDQTQVDQTPPVRGPPVAARRCPFFSLDLLHSSVQFYDLCGGQCTQSSPHQQTTTCINQLLRQITTGRIGRNDVAMQMYVLYERVYCERKKRKEVEQQSRDISERMQQTQAKLERLQRAVSSLTFVTCVSCTSPAMTSSSRTDVFRFSMSDNHSLLMPVQWISAVLCVSCGHNVHACEPCSNPKNNNTNAGVHDQRQRQCRSCQERTHHQHQHQHADVAASSTTSCNLTGELMADDADRYVPHGDFHFSHDSEYPFSHQLSSTSSSGLLDNPTSAQLTQRLNPWEDLP